MKLVVLVVIPALLAWGPALAGDDDWDLCPKTTIKQIVDALHRGDLATLSRPEMIHGTCTSNGHLKNGARIGVQVMFGTFGASPTPDIATRVYTPQANADPNTNPTPTEFAVGSPPRR